MPRPPSSSTDAEELFHTARAIADEAERQTFLAGACAHDAALREYVESLLAAEESAGTFLTGRAEDDRGDQGLGAGDLVGAYRLLEPLGAGGGGEVFLARRDGTDLPVAALKVLRVRAGTRRFLERFDLERGALALMDHPAIARLIDAGVTESGRPYLVMERVEGVPLTRYADEHRLSIRERIAMLRQVCLAVDHAHGQGVVHRDLKSSNVIVAHVDGRPLPKVIDFGVAQAEAAGAGATGTTSSPHFVGTPHAMAPEQAGLDGADVDARADVYALGVLLFELLTGSTPMDAGELAGLELSELRRHISDPPNVLPSERLANLPDAESVAENRGTDTATLVKLCTSELDSVTRRALERDPVRRHGTALELAQDLERVGRALDPVARFQGSRLRAVDPQALGAAIRRELLVAAAAGMERSGANEAARAADLARLEELVGAVNFTTVARHVAAEAVLDPAGAAIDAELEDDPLVHAALLQTQGETLLELELHERAGPPLQRALELRRAALGPDAPETLQSARSYGSYLRRIGRLEEARPLYEEVLAGWTRTAGDDDSRTIDARNNLGALLMNEGQWARAGELLRESVELGRRSLGPHSASVLRAVNNLAAALEQLGRPVEAAEAYREAHEGLRELYGEEDMRALGAAANLARALGAAGELTEAEQLLEETVARSRTVLGDDHPNTLLTLLALSNVVAESGRHAEAIPGLEEAAGGISERLGEHHEYTVVALGDLGSALRVVDLDRAVAVGAEAVRRAENLPASHPQRGAVLLAYGRTLLALERYAEAAEALGAAHAQLMDSFGPDEAPVAEAAAVLAELADVWPGNAPRIMTDVTRILEEIDEGAEGASEELFSLLYDELRSMADRELADERPGNTLQPTALVNEAFLRLVGSGVGWTSRAHFFRVAGRTMRRILVDRAREKGTRKRGGGWRRLAVENATIALDEDPGAVLDLDEALNALRESHPVHAELVTLRFFSGLTLREAGDVLDLPSTSADRTWAFARAWLAHRLQEL